MLQGILMVAPLPTSTVLITDFNGHPRTPRKRPQPLWRGIDSVGCAGQPRINSNHPYSDFLLHFFASLAQVSECPYQLHVSFGPEVFQGVSDRLSTKHANSTVQRKHGPQVAQSYPSLIVSSVSGGLPAPSSGMSKTQCEKSQTP